MEEEKQISIEVKEEDNLIKKANESAERLEKATEELKKENLRHERSLAELRLQGRSLMVKNVEKTEEEKIKEEANMIASSIGRKIW